MNTRRARRAVCLAVALLVLGHWRRLALAQLLGPEFQANSYTTANQGHPVVAAIGSGSLVVIWESAAPQDGSQSAVFGQQFDTSGIPIGTEFRINSYTPFNQSHPAVASDGLGSFVVVWDSPQDGFGVGVVGQRFNSAGTPVGSEFPINSYTSAVEGSPVVTMDGSGAFVVAWDADVQDGSAYGIFGQRFDPSGSPLGGEFQVNSYTTGWQRKAALAGDEVGNFVVVWEGANYQDGSSLGVFGQRFDSAGAAVGSEFLVNSYTTFGQYSPSVGSDSAGRFIVVWASGSQDGSDGGVFGQRFNSAGARLGSEFRVNTYTTGNQELPAVAVGGSGDFVVVWISDAQDGSQTGIFGQRFSSDGSRIGDEFQVNSYTTSQQIYPRVARGAAGNFVVAWDSYTQDGSSFGVFAQQVAGSIFADGFNAADACAWSTAVGGGC